MSLHTVHVGSITITIAVSTTLSDVLGSDELGMARTIIIYGPAALTTVNTVRIGPEKDTAFAATAVLAPGGTPIVITALEAMIIEMPVGAKSLAIIAAGAEAANRVFPVYAVLDIPG